MNQEERRQFLIEELLRERPSRRRQAIPADANRQKVLLRSLMNVRQPGAVSRRFLEVQDAYLQEELAAKKITHLSDLRPVQDGMYLWRGDITTLKCGAIVNAANSGMTGCYQPCHSCIDNCIHTYAGVQLRLKCAEIMERQGFEEPTGQAKITPAYNLPCEYVIHTVGPIVQAYVPGGKKCRAFLLFGCGHRRGFIRAGPEDGFIKPDSALILRDGGAVRFCLQGEASLFRPCRDAGGKPVAAAA